MALNFDNDELYFEGFDPTGKKKGLIKDAQRVVGTKADGAWGPKSSKALERWKRGYEQQVGVLNAANLDAESRLGQDYADAERLGETFIAPAMKPRPGLGVAERAGAELSGADGFSGMSDAKAARIAEIRKRLAEIAEEKKKYNMEEEIGKYKFLYDNDPSVLMNYKQNLRNAEANEQIRKATENSTKAANAQTAWKQNAIDLETANYDMAAARNAYNEAKANGNTEGLNKAYLDMQRTQAKINRLKKENETLRNKFMKDLGLASDDIGDASDVAVSGVDINTDLGQVNELKTLAGELDRLNKDYTVDNIPVDKASKVAKVKKGLAEIATARTKVESSGLEESKKQEMLSKLADLEKTIRNFAKPGSKGGQGTKMTKDDYQAELSKLTTKSQLVAKGYAWLKKAKDLGATHKYLNSALDSAK